MQRVGTLGSNFLQEGHPTHNFEDILLDLREIPINIYESKRRKENPAFIPPFSFRQQQILTRYPITHTPRMQLPWITYETKQKSKCRHSLSNANAVTINTHRTPFSSVKEIWHVMHGKQHNSRVSARIGQLHFSGGKLKLIGYWKCGNIAAHFVDVKQY